CQRAHLGGNSAGQLCHGGGAVAGKIGYRDISLTEGNPAVRGQAVMRDSAVPLPRIGARDPQGSDRATAQDGGSVDGLSRIDARESPASAGSEIARPLAYDNDFSIEREPRRQAAGVG